eukprot:TRINITY_DN2963_c0_g1_i2.p2 TRINITY_DN2963_c0_g1~~TRINITY_DN2963_c0_g1_i2.p2  ORF type:complete len:183 (+),score=59.70 TRINITY_DN2963_c0_g1_i2:49-549(+)
MAGRKERRALGSSSMDDVVLLDEDQISEFKDAFEQILDAHKRGFITKPDLKDLFKRYGVRITDEALDEAFKEADRAHDDQIDFGEFVTMMSHRLRQTASEQALMGAFKTFDPDGNGYIPTKELSEALTTLGKPLNPKELTELISLCENNAGQIKYDLFVNTMFTKK